MMRRDGSPGDATIRLASRPAGNRTRPPTRGLTEGAILAALTAIVAAAGLIAPPVAILLAPLPIIVLVIRWGLRTAALAVVVAALILLQFFGPLPAIISAAVFASLGLTLGWGIRRGIGAQLTILAGSVAFLGASLLGLALTNVVLHQDIFGELIESQVKAMQLVLAAQQRLGAPPQQLDEMRLLWEGVCAEHHCVPAVIPPFLHTVFPMAIPLGALIWAYLCYVLARSVLRRVGHEVPGVPPILSWRLPPALATGIVWTAAGVSLASLRFPWLGGASLNCVLASLFIFGFQGALVGITWMNDRHVPRFTQVLAFVLLITTQTILPVLGLAVIGVLDSRYDYRRLTLPRLPAATTETEGSPGQARSREARRGARSGRRVKAVHPQ